MTLNSNSTRRRFFFSAGAVFSAPLVAGGARVAAADSAMSGNTPGRPEDLGAIQALQRDFAGRINAGRVHSAAELFAGRSVPERLADMRRIAPAEFGEQGVIEIADDGASAVAEVPCIAEREHAVAAEGTVAQMARLQGDGIARRSERGLLTAALIKRGGEWKIQTLSFRAV